MKIKPRLLFIPFLAAAAAYFLISIFQQELSVESSVLRALVSVVAYICIVILLLVPLLTLGWFIFTVWGRAYYRAWHIKRIRNTRLMQRAIAQGRQEE